MTGNLIALSSITIAAAVGDAWKALTPPATIEQYHHGTILDVRQGELPSNTHFSPLGGRESTQDNNDSYDAVKHSEKNWAQLLERLKKIVEG